MLGWRVRYNGTCGIGVSADEESNVLETDANAVCKWGRLWGAWMETHWQYALVSSAVAFTCLPIHGFVLVNTIEAGSKVRRTWGVSLIVLWPPYHFHRWRVHGGFQLLCEERKESLRSVPESKDDWKCMRHYSIHIYGNEPGFHWPMMGPCWVFFIHCAWETDKETDKRTWHSETVLEMERKLRERERDTASLLPPNTLIEVESFSASSRALHLLRLSFLHKVPDASVGYRTLVMQLHHSIFIFTTSCPPKKWQTWWK